MDVMPKMPGTDWKAEESWVNMPNQIVPKTSVITCDGHSQTSSSYMIVIIAYKIIKSYIIYFKMKIYV